MRAMVIVVVLPLPQLVIEQVNIVRDAILVEELVELLFIDAVRAFNFAVQVWRARSDVDVADTPVEQVPVEARLEFRTVVRLDRDHLEGELLEHIVGELDGGLLVQALVDAKDDEAWCSRRWP